jgi:hypothetical protein
MNLKEKEVIELKYPEETSQGLIRFNSRDMIEWTIGTWDVDFPQPSQEELDQLKIDMEPAYQQKLVIKARKYPPIEEQLDMLYHDMKDGTATWVNTITKIKGSRN